ncbi:MAG: DUF2786 domain-containing protein [Eggerthellaceae bacterium]|nr:DUF2786 domain-containing protein [Eggerthellaceae bacterium]
MSDRDSIITKIKKLLEHSTENGATEAEAVAFALKAQKLMAEHDVKDWELGDKVEEVIEYESKVNARRVWRGPLAKVIAENFRCASFMCWRVPDDKINRKAYVTFVGYAADAKAAATVFEHLYVVMDELGKKASRMHGDSSAYDGFCKGFVDGVESELEKQSQALMLVVPQAVKEHIDAMDIGYGGTVRKRMNEEAESKGYTAGRDAVRERRLDTHDDFLLECA